ncbi:hypothetical protein EC957_007460 [Mortierella hygrophila]|uniref:Uncharacterized protein n=1 Tax=Mortierella hygrophila TaxID=979708 RepID=A0A9P6FDJ2_9FUNG|nr:hypothetical protein EC957_007460 [Mortierella hygrophila]
MTIKKPQKSASASEEALTARLEAVSLDLRNTQLDLEGANDDLASAHEELEDTRVKLDETELKLKNTQDALVASENALVASEEARCAANHDRVIARPESKQEVFAVLKFRRPQPLPVGAFRLLARQRKSTQATLDQFIAKNPDLDAVEVDELRFDRSPRGQYVYQHMMDDKHAPIKFSRRRFVVKDGHTEDEMKTYILNVFNTHTRE